MQFDLETKDIFTGLIAALLGVLTYVWHKLEKKVDGKAGREEVVAVEKTLDDLKKGQEEARKERREDVKELHSKFDKLMELVLQK